MSCYTDEIFGPVLIVVRVPSYEEAVDLVNGSPYGNGDARSSPTTGARPGGSRPRSRSAWSASTCRSRCRWPTTRSAAGRPRCSATPTCYGTEGVHFYTRGKVVTSRWLDPSHGGVNLGFPVNT